MASDRQSAKSGRNRSPDENLSIQPRLYIFRGGKFVDSEDRNDKRLGTGLTRFFPENGRSISHAEGQTGRSLDFERTAKRGRGRVDNFARLIRETRFHRL